MYESPMAATMFSCLLCCDPLQKDSGKWLNNKLENAQKGQACVPFRGVWHLSLPPLCFFPIFAYYYYCICILSFLWGAQGRLHATSLPFVSSQQPCKVGWPKVMSKLHGWVGVWTVLYPVLTQHSNHYTTLTHFVHTWIILFCMTHMEFLLICFGGYRFWDHIFQRCN